MARKIKAKIKRRGVASLELQADQALRGGQVRDAIGILGRLVAQERTNGRAHFKLACALQQVGEHATAIKVFSLAQPLLPKEAAVPNNIGLSLMALGEMSRAVACFEQTLAMDPARFEACANLSNALRTTGRLDEALDALAVARRLAPDNADLDRLYLMTQMYVPDVSADDLFEAHRDYARRHESFSKNNFDFSTHGHDPERRIKIGVVSSDLRDHPVGLNSAPLLLHLDSDQFETHYYAELDSMDAVTDQFKSKADHWVSTRSLSDAQLIDKIRADQIDIMLYLAGHLDHNRSLVAAHRPAPIQISFHDIATSGLTAMDYWLTDGYLHPSGHSERFTERLVRLPQFYAYLEPTNTPEVSATPCASDSPIAFCSFNNPAKINRHVIDLWAELLAAVADSTLLLAYTGARGKTEQRAVQTAFAERGVAERRIIFSTGKKSRNDHLRRYYRADIALDPFPFNGATTTFEALWMGVPVITLLGERFVARAAGSLLHAVGLDELVATNAAEFVKIGQTLASDRAKIAALRQALRPIVAQSLCDGPKYSRWIQRTFRAIWRDWCRRQDQGEK